MSPGGVMFWRGQLGNVFHRNSNWTDFCGKVLDSKDSLEIFGDLFHMFFFFTALNLEVNLLGAASCLSMLEPASWFLDSYRIVGVWKLPHTFDQPKKLRKKKTHQKKNESPKMASLTSPHNRHNRLKFLASFHRQGEWVCAQASKDVGTANWVCVEHRPVGAVTKLIAHWFPTLDRPWLSGFFCDPGLNWDPFFQGESTKTANVW